MNISTLNQIKYVSSANCVRLALQTAATTAGGFLLPLLPFGGASADDDIGADGFLLVVFVLLPANVFNFGGEAVDCDDVGAAVATSLDLCWCCRDESLWFGSVELWYSNIVERRFSVVKTLVSVAIDLNSVQRSYCCATENRSTLAWVPYASHELMLRNWTSTDGIMLAEHLWGTLNSM